METSGAFEITVVVVVVVVTRVVVALAVAGMVVVNVVVLTTVVGTTCRYDVQNFEATASTTGLKWALGDVQTKLTILGFVGVKGTFAGGETFTGFAFAKQIKASRTHNKDRDGRILMQCISRVASMPKRDAVERRMYAVLYIRQRQVKAWRREVGKWSCETKKNQVDCYSLMARMLVLVWLFRTRQREILQRQASRR